MSKAEQKERLAKHLYSVEEASQYIGRSVCATRELIWAGKLPIVKIDRRIYVDIRDLDALIERNKIQFPY